MGHLLNLMLQVELNMRESVLRLDQDRLLDVETGDLERLADIVLLHLGVGSSELKPRCRLFELLGHALNT